MSLGRMKVGRQAGRQARGIQREREREREREQERDREERRRRARGGSREESERERGRLASQFPAARYIYEAHKVASTTAYIAT